jgi:formylglycine-generating enzyme required for sulfatase activity
LSITVNAGSYRLLVEKSGFQEFTTQLTVAEGETKRVVAALSPLNASAAAPPTVSTPPTAQTPQIVREPPNRMSGVPPAALAPFDAVQAKQYQSQWATYLGTTVDSANSIGMRLVLIPPGEFHMGSSTGRPPDATPRHRVRLARPFLMGAHEVSQGQFAAFVAATGHVTDAERQPEKRLWNPDAGGWLDTSGYSWRDPGFAQDEDHPVALVSWTDAAAFCDWLCGKEGRSYRLPTEAEWEYCYRAGSTAKWYCGDNLNQLGLVANIADESLKQSHPNCPRTGAWNDGHVFTAPLGSLGSNAFGLCDMAGNVYEWCYDWYQRDYYRESPSSDPEGPAKATNRVIRGGGWNCAPDMCTAFSRNGLHPPDWSTNTLGFRVVCEVDTSAVRMDDAP